MYFFEGRLFVVKRHIFTMVYYVHIIIIWKAGEMIKQLKALTALTKVSRSFLNCIIGDLKLPVNLTKRIKYSLHPSSMDIYTHKSICICRNTHTHTEVLESKLKMKV